MTVEELAASVDISKGHLSRIERGEKAPSLATLEAIARSLKVEMAQLFGEKINDDDVVIVRKAERVSSGDSKSYQIDALLAGSEARPLAAYVVSPGPKFLEHDVPEHVGQEFLYVLQGRIEVAVADRLFMLEAGDCAAYDAGLRHKIRRKSTSVVRVLVILVQN